ncbi:MAG: methylase [Bacilli bacterium]|nr:methylase [Bacilli bacterium]
MSELNELNARKERAEYYEQVGVAMTCRSFAEYEKIFSLNLKELEHVKLLDIAAGASSFTAGARAQGYEAVAVDPLYVMDLAEMAEYGHKEIEISTAKLASLAHKFDWDYYGSIELHRENRERSLDIFLQDYAAKDEHKNYIPCSLPKLPFADNTFSLVLCSHFLFLYAEQFDYVFHLNAVLEMLRVSRKGGQVRIYPLLDLKQQPYPYLEQLIKDLEKKQAIVEKKESKLPFIPGSTHMLCIHK